MNFTKIFEIFKALFAGAKPEKVKKLIKTLMNA